MSTGSEKKNGVGVSTNLLWRQLQQNYNQVYMVLWCHHIIN